MFNKAQVLEVSRKILGSESSERSGTVLFGEVLCKVFDFFNWKSLPVHGESTVYYVETNPKKGDVDLVCYVNADTANPSQLSLWTETEFDPLAITVKKGRIYGLGAAHEKMSTVPQCLALQSLKDHPNFSEKNIILAVGYGRESKMRGARRLIAEVLKGRDIKKVCVAHPTRSEVLYGSAGRLKTKVFFPFSEKEKEIRSTHDLSENILSQSKVYSYTGGTDLRANTIFQMIESCKSLPKGTVLLDVDGGSATITEPETTYFEVDSFPPFKDSMVFKFENFGEQLIGLDESLRAKFENPDLKRAIHIGKCFDSEDGVTFFGLNLIPAHTDRQALDAWFAEFETAVEAVGGELMITDAKAPYVNEGAPAGEIKHCLSVTEASIFSKFCDDVVILGPGKEGLAKKPNESVDIDALVRSCHVYKKMFSNVFEG